MDRITGFTGFTGLKSNAKHCLIKNGQDYRITGFTGLIKSNAKHCLIKQGQDYRIYGIKIKC